MWQYPQVTGISCSRRYAVEDLAHHMLGQVIAATEADGIRQARLLLAGLGLNTGLLCDRFTGAELVL
jgi:hypothetical protein